jgi:phosphatidylserine/phosphatidylglycerophosphate/cardiolipin synthase-like enzyme
MVRYRNGFRRGLPVYRAGLLLCLAITLAVASPAPAKEIHTTRTALLKNREYGQALISGISTARSRILISCYLFKITASPGNLPRRIAEELISARRRGVQVSVIFEQSRDTQDFLNQENLVTAELLQRNGIIVRFDTLRRTSHSKVVVIDGRYVYLGSHNLTHSALGRNNELSVLIESPELAREITDYLGGV